MGLPNMESTLQHMTYVATNETIFNTWVFVKSFQDLLKIHWNTQTEIFDDLNVVSKELGGSNVSEKVLLKIKNTMSD